LVFPQPLESNDANNDCGEAEDKTKKPESVDTNVGSGWRETWKSARFELRRSARTCPVRNYLELTQNSGEKNDRWISEGVLQILVGLDNEGCDNSWEKPSLFRVCPATIIWDNTVVLSSGIIPTLPKWTSCGIRHFPPRRCIGIQNVCSPPFLMRTHRWRQWARISLVNTENFH